MSLAVVTDLGTERHDRAVQLRAQATAHYREADELRALAEQYDLAGSECEKRAYEIEPY